MQKSARILGEEFGLTAAEMNFLLRDKGYLEGSPGKWGVTDKGTPFAVYTYYTNPSWEMLTWDENITSDMDLSGEHRQEFLDAIREEKRATAAATVPEDVPEKVSGGSEANWLIPVVVIVLTAGTIYLIRKALPRLKALWRDKTAARIANRKSGELRESAEVRSGISDDPTGEDIAPKIV